VLKFFPDLAGIAYSETYSARNNTMYGQNAAPLFWIIAPIRYFGLAPLIDAEELRRLFFVGPARLRFVVP
jgi:hypothetical protein